MPQCFAIMQAGPKDGSTVDFSEERWGRVKGFHLEDDLDHIWYRRTGEIDPATGREIFVYDPSLRLSAPHTTAIVFEAES